MMIFLYWQVVYTLISKSCDSNDDNVFLAGLFLSNILSLDLRQTVKRQPQRDLHILTCRYPHVLHLARQQDFCRNVRAKCSSAGLQPKLV